jgi:competence protein ComEC
MIILIAFISLFLGANLIKEYTIIIAILSLLFFALCLYKIRKKALIFVPLFFVIGIGISFINPTYNPDNNNYQGVVLEARENYYIFYSGGERFYIAEYENKKEIGDILTVKGYSNDLEFYKKESEMDFEKYLNQKGCRRQLFVKNEHVDFSMFFRKKAIKQKFLNSFDENAHTLIDCLLFNEKDYDSELVNNAKSLNLLYLFSISGIYLRLLMLAIEKFLSFYFNKNQAQIITLIMLSLYFIFALEKTSVLRILLIYISTIINNAILKKKFSYPAIIGFIGIVMLLINRYYAEQMSFYLGFAISIFLLFTANIIKCKSKILTYILTSILIMVFMLPISIMSTHDFHFLSLIFQLIIIPFNCLYMFISLISFYTTPFIYLLNPLGDFICMILNTFMDYDLVIYLREMNAYYSLFYYLFLFLILLAIESKFSLFIKINSIVISFMVISLAIPFDYGIKKSVDFINVGQGDSALISNGPYHYLIDTGGNVNDDIAQNCLMPYFKKNNIYKIDGIFLSHYDYDHCGALDSLKNNFNVGAIYDFSSNYPVDCQGITINNLNKNNHDNDNDNSAVLYFSFIGKKWLFTGDISSTIEKELIVNYPDLDVDILKVAHHGSDTATSLSFIKKITPKEAVISVGKNKYGHPNSSVIRILQQCGVIIRRTDIEGTISYNSLSFNI